jgi:hypothetical protein
MRNAAQPAAAVAQVIAVVAVSPAEVVHQVAAGFPVAVQAVAGFPVAHQAVAVSPAVVKVVAGFPVAHQAVAVFPAVVKVVAGFPVAHQAVADFPVAASQAVRAQLQVAVDFPAAIVVLQADLVVVQVTATQASIAADLMAGALWLLHNAVAITGDHKPIEVLSAASITELV